MSPRPRGVRRGDRPSLADVAQAAGVSAQTVSRVVNGHEGVVPETRARVLESLRAVGYQPNTAARALATGRYGAIGVLVFSVSRLGDVRSLSGITQAAGRAGRAIQLLSLEEATAARVDSGIAALSASDVDGLVLVEADLLERFDVAVRPGLPLVTTDAVPGPFPSVDTDQAAGSRAAVEHLLDLGHRTVHHLAGPPTSRAAQVRARTWEEVLRGAGRPVPPPVVGDWTSASGHRAGHLLASLPEGEVTAVFSANDQMALGLLRALHERDRRVPQDVSVVGFDDVAEAGDFWPPLTTVHQDFETVGEHCVRILLEEIAHPGRHRTGTTVVPVHLQLRASTAPPPS